MLDELRAQLVCLAQFLGLNATNEVYAVASSRSCDVKALFKHISRQGVGLTRRSHHGQEHDVPLFALERTSITAGDLVLRYHLLAQLFVEHLHYSERLFVAHKRHDTNGSPIKSTVLDDSLDFINDKNRASGKLMSLLR